jgi:hypothetical protein
MKFVVNIADMASYGGDADYVFISYFFFSLIHQQANTKFLFFPGS